MKHQTLLLAALFIAGITANPCANPSLFAATDAPAATSLPSADEVMAQAKI